MTRDEAKEKAFKCEGFHSGVNYQEHLTDGIWLLRSDVLNFIDKIYDEFENRICGSCKYYYYDREDALGLCENEDNNQEYLYDSKMQITSDFCCNKWEAKLV